MPRHSPYALFRLNSFSCFVLSRFASCLSFANNCLGRHKKLPFYHCFPPESFDSNAKLFFSHFSERPSNLSIKKSFLQLSVSFRFFIRFSMIVCLASLRTLVGPSNSTTKQKAYALDFLACARVLADAGRPKWTRTTDLVLIRHAL